MSLPLLKPSPRRPPARRSRPLLAQGCRPARPASRPRAGRDAGVVLPPVVDPGDLLLGLWQLLASRPAGGLPPPVHDLDRQPAS